MSNLPIDLWSLKQETGRTMESLCVEAPINDPFAMHQEFRQRDADWFANNVWHHLSLGERPIHLRAIHYKLVSLETPVITPIGENYENTTNLWKYLQRAARDARYLGLVPYSLIIDERTEEPECFYFDETSTGVVDIDRGEDVEIEPAYGASLYPIRISLGTYDQFEYPNVPDFPDVDLPTLELTEEPTRSSQLHVEIWIEKSTMAHILRPIAQRYRCNLVQGTGDQSTTRCHGLIERAKRWGKPVRVLYLSDFDPKGDNMPVAVACKIDFMLRQQNLDLDIQVRPVMLTHDQCVQYELPRTPTKEKGGRFEERYGEGGTELDALEALHPGVLEHLVSLEIARYHDDGFQERVDESIDDFKDDIDTFNNSIHSQHQPDIDAIRVEHDADVEALNAALRPLQQEHRRAIRDFNRAVRPLENDYRRHAEVFNAKTEVIEAQRAALMGDFNQRSEAREQRLNEICAAVVDDIEQSERPDLSSIDWPEPEFDEDDDPLYRSSRDYIEQVDIFRTHQGKPLNGRLAARRLLNRRRSKIFWLKAGGHIDKAEAQRLIDNPDLPVPDEPDDDD